MTIFNESRKPQQFVGVGLEAGDDGDSDPEDKQLVSTTTTTTPQPGEPTTLIWDCIIISISNKNIDSQLKALSR